MKAVRFVVGVDPPSLLERIAGTWQRKIEQQAEEFINKLTELGVTVADYGFSIAEYDGTNDVRVTFQNRGKLERAIIATGTVTLFIEYGTGINYPVHPDPDAFPHGSYGYHLGLLPNGWRYPAANGAGTNGVPDANHPGYIHTMGNPANAPMYEARKSIERQIATIARMVFI